jgi:deoxyribodipyrimidine photo-lyase
VNSKASLVWFRNDLRTEDNPALNAAHARGPVVPVFVWSPEEEGEWRPGSASNWWLHKSLRALELRLKKLGSRLIIRRGPAREALRGLLEESSADALFWNRRYEPAIIARDSRIRESLSASGFEVESFSATLLHEPWSIKNQSGKGFQVFTPFWKHCLNKSEPGAPLPPPERLRAPRKWPKSVALELLGLDTRLHWTEERRVAWQPGEAGARANLERFLNEGFDDYPAHRNSPELRGTSQLSPHLHFGEISPRQIWDGLRQMAAKANMPTEKWLRSQFLAELGWREFAYHLLFHFPYTTSEPLRAEFKGFAWRENGPWLDAWQKGLTGFPIVDAGMRELSATGWMHNRVRMIVASFLVKDLLLPWQEGARWFWEKLVDADLASNTLGWQWSAGCGADAAPYFRVFNPTTQGEKFDPQGGYVRRWCPELAGLPAKWIHRPQVAPLETLSASGIQIGSTYPEPIVQHSIAREVALEAYSRMKGKLR